jgi:uncharacterized OsmC-like protein
VSLQSIAVALERVRHVLTRRPDMALHDDTPATAQWRGGMRNVVSHGNGTAIETDMAEEVGGTGDRVSPGWLFRAGLASCAVTSIAMRAAAEGIALTTLEAHVESRTDMRGMLGMASTDGTPVHAGPSEIHLRVRIAAAGVAADDLQALVARGCRCSPVPSAVATPTPLAIHVDVV